MNEKTYLKYVKKIDKLMKTRNHITVYNLSGAGWQDYYTARERASLERRRDKNNLRRDKYSSAIADILVLLVSAGYPIDDIISKYERVDMFDILSMRSELDSYKENMSSKKMS